MRRRGKRFGTHAMVLLIMLTVMMRIATALTVTMAIGPDEPLSYPGTLNTLPDEHTTFIPLVSGKRDFLVFAASGVTGGTGGAVVLITSDLKSFAIAPGYQTQVMLPPVPFNRCDPAFDQAFDENYVGPGTVIRDPVGPPGHLIMLYEAENHCPGGQNQFAYYASIGLARSSDLGKMWPPPVTTRLGNKLRHPVLTIPSPEPNAPDGVNLGDAIPSAFSDGNYVYVIYRHALPAGPASNGVLRVARATFDRAHPDTELEFRKWYMGGFTEPGVGGDDTAILPSAGCPGYQNNADLSYNDYLGRYLLVVTCASGAQRTAAWYFSTATSLEKQDWTTPQMIDGSQRTYTWRCSGPSRGGAEFDGWYPSIVTAGLGTGYSGSSGYVFYLNGCNGSLQRRFMRRSYTIEMR